MGDTFSITHSDGELRDNTEFDVIGSGTQSLKVRTKCDEPLAVGDQFGSLLLVELTSKDGGTVTLPEAGEECSYTPPRTRCHDDITFLNLRYLGGVCGDTTNLQEGALGCSGGDPGANVTVVPDDADVIALASATPLNVGDLVGFVHTGGKLESTTEFTATGDDDSQTLNIHTSCSKPLNLGDRFGAFEVVLIAYEDGTIDSLFAIVDYVYTVTNPNAGSVTGLTITDDQLSPPQSPIT